MDTSENRLILRDVNRPSRKHGVLIKMARRIGDLFFKMLNVASVSYVPEVTSTRHKPVYSRTGMLWRRLTYNLLRKSWLFKKEFFFIYHLESRESRLRQSREELDSIRNIHRGRRGFVIANGPSLDAADLERLTNEITIAANKIHLMFENTAWRPQYFSVTDELVWNRITPDIQRNYNRIYILDNLDIRHAISPTTSVRQLSPRHDTRQGNKIPFSGDLRFGAFSGYSVTYFNLQLAWFLGLSPVYLLGLDHEYRDEPLKGRSFVQKGQHNHFLPNYRKPGERVMRARPDKIERYLQIAEQFSRANGWQILNASRYSATKAFTKVEFDSICRNP